MRWKVKGAPDCCPHCGKGPLFCPGCGESNVPKCLQCKQWTLFNPKAPEYSHPKGFLLEGNPPKESIVQASEWDGSDWFCVGTSPFISNRAKVWLEEAKATPIRFRPALLDIEGVEGRFEQR